MYATIIRDGNRVSFFYYSRAQSLLLYLSCNLVISALLGLSCYFQFSVWLSWALFILCTQSWFWGFGFLVDVWDGRWTYEQRLIDKITTPWEGSGHV